MAESLMEKHKQYTRTMIKKKFMELYEEKTLEKMTVSGICSFCGISRSAFYQHFDDKYSVLEEVCDEILSYLERLNVNMHEIKIRDTDASMPLWAETASYISDRREYIRPLICYPGEQAFIDRWHRLIKDTIRRRLIADNYQNKKYLEVTAYSMASAIIGLYQYWFRLQPELSPEEIARIGSRLLWSSFYSFPKL